MKMLSIPKCQTYRVETLKSLRQPLTGIIIALGCAFLGLLYYHLVLDYLQSNTSLFEKGQPTLNISEEVIKPFFSWSIALLAFVTPIFTTASLSQEYRQKTFYIWARSSLAPFKIVLGKFFSILSILLVFMGYVLGLTACLQFDTTLPWGIILLSLSGITLLAGCFTSWGLLVSSLIENPLLALGITFIGNIVWMLLEWLLVSQPWSLLALVENSFHGIFVLSDYLYLLMFTLFWLMLTERIIMHRKVRFF